MRRELLLVAALAISAASAGRVAGAPQSAKSTTLPAVQTATLRVSGMTCASCDVAVRLAAKSVAGVQAVTVDYANGKAEVTYDATKTNPSRIAEAITKRSGFKTAPVETPKK